MPINHCNRPSIIANHNCDADHQHDVNSVKSDHLPDSNPKRPGPYARWSGKKGGHLPSSGKGPSTVADFGNSAILNQIQNQEVQVAKSTVDAIILAAATKSSTVTDSVLANSKTVSESEVEPVSESGPDAENSRANLNESVEEPSKRRPKHKKGHSNGDSNNGSPSLSPSLNNSVSLSASASGNLASVNEVDTNNHCQEAINNMSKQIPSASNSISVPWYGNTHSPEHSVSESSNFQNQCHVQQAAAQVVEHCPELVINMSDVPVPELDLTNWEEDLVIKQLKKVYILGHPDEWPENKLKSDSESDESANLAQNHDTQCMVEPDCTTSTTCSTSMSMSSNCGTVKSVDSTYSTDTIQNQSQKKEILDSDL